MRRYLVLLLAVVCLGGVDSALAQGVLKKAPAAADRSFPFPVIELSGSADELGVQHGKQLQKPIHTLYEQYLRANFKNDLERLAALTAAQMFTRHLLPEHLEEIKSLAKQVELDEREVMLAQCFLDLLPMVACSTIALPAEASADGVARFGRNLDFPSRNIADRHTVVLIYRPKGRYAFAAVTWPGMVGVLSGMNEHGLTLANMEVERSGAMARAMPYILLYRMVLERCRTVDEAIELLERTPRQSANNLMLMDATGASAVVEITPASVAVRRGDGRSALISTNHQRGQDAATRGRCWRYDELRQSSDAKIGRIALRDVEAMLRSVSQGKMTMQSMVFEPSQRVIYLSAGQNAARKQFHRLDLTGYFAEGGR